MNRDSERIYDEYLVAAATSGDDAALARLVQRFQPRLLRHAWRLLGDGDRARDVVQDAWIGIVRGLDDAAAFPAWALRIVTRRCGRVRGGDRADEASGNDALDAIASPDVDEAERMTESALVVRAMAALPTAQRATLSLFYAESLSVAEIAVALDVPPGTVKTRLMHARNRLRALLDEPHGQDRRDDRTRADG